MKRPVVTIDSLNLTACDLIKIDCDGPELAILQGAEATIARCRPVIYCENDKPEKYPDLMPWLIRHEYRLYQHYAPLYDEDNFRKNKVNVFGNIVSAMLLCVPQERKDVHPLEWGIAGLSRVRQKKAS
jgi:Methyltransferase FkbM domain